MGLPQSRHSFLWLRLNVLRRKVSGLGRNLFFLELCKDLQISMLLKQCRKVFLASE